MYVKVKKPFEHVRLGITTVNDFVQNQHHGKCLSEIYINNKQKLLFECKFKHQWYSNFDNIKNKGKWCPDCKKFNGERICNAYFDTIFGVPFLKSKPTWLIGPKGYKLELDGFNEDLKIAFEHQGLQHYKITEFSKTEEKLKEIKRNDRIKKKLCKQNGVKLFIIPQIPTLTKMENLIKIIISQSKKLNINLPHNVQEIKINLDLDPINNIYLEKFKQIAIERGGKCLSTEYINCDSKLHFRCKLNHDWWASPDNVKNKNSWCRRCAKFGPKSKG